VFFPLNHNLCCQRHLASGSSLTENPPSTNEFALGGLTLPPNFASHADATKLSNKFQKYFYSFTQVQTSHVMLSA